MKVNLEEILELAKDYPDLKNKIANKFNGEMLKDSVKYVQKAFKISKLEQQQQKLYAECAKIAKEIQKHRELLKHGKSYINLSKSNKEKLDDLSQQLTEEFEEITPDQIEKYISIQ